MKKNTLLMKRSLVVIPIVLVILLTGCGIEAEKARKPSDDFSRGLPLAENASSSVAVVFEPDGDLIQAVIPSEAENGQVVFRYLQISGNGKIIFDQDLSEDLGATARSPQMISDPDQLHLFWISREIADTDWQLWYGRLNRSGEFISKLRQISEGSERVDQYDIERDGSGGVFVIWDDIETMDIQYTRLSSTGELLSKPQILINGGENPSLVVDEDGAYHLTWMKGKYLNYKSIVGKIEPPLEGDPLTEIRVSPGNRLEGPVIGTAGGQNYVFWSILRQTGLEAGTAITEYLVFPEGHPENAQRKKLPIYHNNQERFQPYQGDINLSQIILPPPEEYLTTDFVYDPWVGPNQGDTLLVGVAASQSIRLDTYIQIIILIFEDGENIGYVIPTRTNKISKLPRAYLDTDGDIHLIWQDGTLGNQVYYTSTASEVKATLDRVSLADLPSLILSGGLEAITGILLFPFAFPWMAVGFLIMVIWRLVRNDEDVTLLPSKILLGVALVSYQVAKLLFLPDIMVYVPFSAWIDISPEVGSILMIAVPLIIFGIGFLIAEWSRRNRTSNPSSLLYYLIVVVVDTILTLSVYGVIFLGEY